MPDNPTVDTRKLATLERNLEKKEVERTELNDELKTVRKELTDTQRLLKKEQDNGAKLQQERDDLKALRADLERELGAQAKEVATVTKQFEKLVAENERLAKQVGQLDDIKTLQKAAAEARTAADQAEKLRLEAVAVTEKLLKEQTATTKENERLASRVEDLSAQVKEKKGEPALPPGEVAKLLNEFVDELGKEAQGLDVLNGEVTLNVAFGARGSARGFLIPTADSTPELRESLQQISFRFHRALPDALENGG